MELKKARQVSNDYGISTRMLRYYEQVGLIQSRRTNDYAWRVYDEKALARLQKIIILRKLRIPVKSIARILNNSDAIQAIEIFKNNICQIDKEITALTTIKKILIRFVEDINETTGISIKSLSNENLLSIIDTLSFPKNEIIESRMEISMEDLGNANETLHNMSDKEIRIVFLPPMTVAAYCAHGAGCEEKANQIINNFVIETDLINIKPDLRQFGFDCSHGKTVIGEPSHAYEAWVSIPDDMDLPSPLIKRKYNGGMYAAHVLRAWDFQDWRLLQHWVNTNGKYSSAWGKSRWTPDETGAGQGLEEQLNYPGNANHGFKIEDMQLDLLFPIFPSNSVVSTSDC